MAIDPYEPVFPISYNHVGDNGLTKREHFAGLAMQGMLASQGNGGEYFKLETIAKESVEVADALIAELEKTEGGA